MPLGRVNGTHWVGLEKGTPITKDVHNDVYLEVSLQTNIGAVKMRNHLESIPNLTNKTVNICNPCRVARTNDLRGL